MSVTQISEESSVEELVIKNGLTLVRQFDSVFQKPG